MKQVMVRFIAVMETIMIYQKNNSERAHTYGELDSMMWVVNTGLNLLAIAGIELIKIGDDIASQMSKYE